MFLTIWVYLQRAVTKKRKKNKKVLLLNKDKGDEDCILNDKGTENLL